MRIAVHGEPDQLARDAAIIEQRVALRGRAIGQHRLARAPRRDEEVADRQSRLAATFVLETTIDRRPVEPCQGLAPAQALECKRGAPRRVLGCRRAGASEPPCVGNSSTSKTRRRMRAKDPLEGREREVRQMLVIDRVELDVLRSGATDAEAPAWCRPVSGRRMRRPANEIVDVGDVRQHVVGDDQVGPVAFRAQRGRRRRGRNSRSGSGPPWRSQRPPDRWPARFRAHGCRRAGNIAAGYPSLLAISITSDAAPSLARDDRLGGIALRMPAASSRKRTNNTDTDRRCWPPARIAEAATSPQARQARACSG